MQPAITVRRPLLFPPADRRSDRFGASLPSSAEKRLLEIAGRDAAQVENRQQGIEALRPPRPFRQDRLCEGDAIAAHLACCIATTVAQLGAPHRNWADPRLDLTLRTMAVPHHTGAIIGKPVCPASQPGTHPLPPQPPGPEAGVRHRAEPTSGDRLSRLDVEK